MIYILFHMVLILIGIYRCVHAQAPPSNQCQQYFQYAQLGSTNIGKISIPNIVPGTTKVFVEFSQRESLAKPNYYGNLGLYDDKDTTIKNLYSGQPILYRVDFPTPNVLPKITLISVNDVVLCKDAAYPPPSTVLRLSHTITAGDLGATLVPYQGPNQIQFPTVQPAKSPPNRFKPAVARPSNQNMATQSNPNTQSNANGECGMENRVITPYIVGGELLNPNQFPWLVAIFTSKDVDLNFLCGGTLVSSRTVVTAAHCFQNNFAKILVHLGHYDLADYSERFETRSVQLLIKHPEFNALSLPDADIALLRFERAISFSKTIRPACLWNEQIDSNLLAGQRATVAGWGENEMRQMQTKPKWAKANIVSSGECQSALKDNLVKPDARALCVRSIDGSTACHGDSGGGLLVYRNGRWTLRGVVSGGHSNDRGCLSDYTFFCDLAQHRTWLSNNIV